MAKLPLSCYFSTLNFLKSCHLMNIDGAPSQPGRMEYGAQVHFIPSLFTSIDTSSSARPSRHSSPFKFQSLFYFLFWRLHWIGVLGEKPLRDECSQRLQLVSIRAWYNSSSREQATHSKARSIEYAQPIATFVSHFCGVISPHVLSLLQFLIAAYSLWKTL